MAEGWPDGAAAPAGSGAMAPRYIVFAKDMRRSLAQGVKLHFLPGRDGHNYQCFWELRHLLEPLWNKQASQSPLFHRWWKKARKTYLCELFEAMGFDKDMDRPSARQARALGYEGVDLAQCAPESTAATVVVLVALACLGVCAKLVADKRQAFLALGDFLRAALPPEFVPDGMSTPECDIEVPETPPLCAFVRAEGEWCPCVKAVESPTNCTELPDFLKALVAKSFHCHFAREWLASVVGLLAEAIDGRAAAGCMGGLSPENFPVLRGLKRARRLDKGIAAHAAEAVASKRFRSTARIGAAGNIPMSHGTARTTDARAVVDYVYEVRQVASQSCQLQVSLDASVVGGGDTTFYAAWWHKTGVGAWLVPQAACTASQGSSLAIVFAFPRRLAHIPLSPDLLHSK